MNIVITILLTILVFGLIIFIHELGHFIMAKVNGVKVREFALGMGPTLFRFGKGETRYALRLFPIGGFVSMEGEDEESADERAFHRKPVWRRILIVIAGAVMNIVLGFVIMTIVVGMQTNIATMEVSKFREFATSNQAGGLQAGDVIQKIDGLRIWCDTDFFYALERGKTGGEKGKTTLDGQEVDTLTRSYDIQVKRDGKKVLLEDVKITVTSNTVDLLVKGESKNVFTVLREAGNKTVSTARMVWLSLGDLLRGSAGLKDLSGPVGVAQVVGQASGMGLQSFLTLVAFITINVGIFNVLPLPALDGGRLVFLIIEGIRRKPVPAKYEGYVHAAGFILLMLLMIVVTFSDVFKLFH